MATSPQEVLVECRQHDVKAVGLHVTDTLGRWHQLTIPLARLTEEAFEDGFAWTWPRLGGMQGEVLDVLLMPQPQTAFIQPGAELPTLSLLCTMHDPLTREELPEDPRTIAVRAEKFARDSGVADQVLLNLAIEFFLFDHRSSRRHARGASSRMGDPLRELTMDTDRMESTTSLARAPDDYRNELMQALIDCGVNVAAHQQADGDRGKSRLQFSQTSLVSSADHVMIAKHVVRSMAARWGKLATFMPVPHAGCTPAGMPTQVALTQHEQCVLSGSGHAGLSDNGMHAIGGILKHAAALSALINSTTNSYARLSLGLSAGGAPSGRSRLPLIAYAQGDARAVVRVPMHRASGFKSLEIQVCDALCNPYLAFAGLLMAMVDGVQNKIQPGPALDPDPYGNTHTESTSYQRVPDSLSSALQALEDDGDFLLRGDVFSAEVLQNWINHKRSHEVEALRVQPHPHELAAYFDG